MLKSVTYACRSSTYHLVQLPALEKYLAQHLSNKALRKRNFYLLSHNCLFNCNTRNFVDKTSKVEQEENFYRFWEEYRVRLMKERCLVNKLVKGIQYSEDEARKVVEDNRYLLTLDTDTMQQKIDLLVGVKIPLDGIRKNIWILRIALERLQLYLESMKKWQMAEHYLPEFLPMLDMTPKEFLRFSEIFNADIENHPHENRVLFVAKKLKHPVSEVLPKMMVHKFLFRSDVNQIEERINLFLEFGVDESDILSDLSAITGSVGSMRKKLTVLRDMGFHPIKPWMARQSGEKYQSAVAHFLAEKEANSYSSHEEFLAATLNVDEEKLKSMKAEIQYKYPFFFKVRALTFVKKARFLLNAGYLSNELLDFPFIFYYGIGTLKKRLETLQKMGIEKPSLLLLTKNNSCFERILDYYLQSDHETKSAGNHNLE